MTGFDVAVLIMIGFSAILGFMRGFVQEFFALLAWIFAVLAIHNLHPQMTDAVLPYVKLQSGASVLAFAILLLIPYAVTKLLANRLGQASRNSVVGPIDRLLGLGFGAVKGTLVVVMGFSVLVLGYDVAWGEGGRPDWIVQSRSYPFINASSKKLVVILAERRADAADAELEKPVKHGHKKVKKLEDSDGG
ncbi:MAG: hypothetical protein RLY97_435 [Pseudomonadota bacterium]|jgi:membrane protein required for colicin V production